MKFIVVHPTGNQHVKNACLSFLKKKKLYAFITSVYFNTKEKRYLLINNKIRKLFKKRDFNKINNKIIEYSLFTEFLRLFYIRFSNYKFIKYLLNYFSTSAVWKRFGLFASNFVSDDINLVYAYENCALSVFEKAKKMKNIKCVYELTSIYWRAKKNIKSENMFSSKEDLLIKDKEIGLSDLIIAPSENVKDSLKLFPYNLPKIKIINYGFPKARKSKKFYKKKNPLKILYVGSISPEKGTKYLINALNSNNILKIKNQFEFTIITNINGKKYFDKHIKMKKKIFTYLPHDEVLNLMNKNHILIVPSLSEGFSMVISEAMSQAMLVMGTKNTCLRDFSNKNNSIVIPERNSTAIINNLIKLKNNPNLVNKIRKAAYTTAKKYSWEDYKRKLFLEAGIK